MMGLLIRQTISEDIVDEDALDENVSDQWKTCVNEIRDAIQHCVAGIAIPGGVDAMVAAMSERHSSVPRMHRNRFSPESAADSLPFLTEPVPWYPLGRRVTEPEIRASRYLAYAGGDYYLQDAGSLLAIAAAGCDGESLRDKTVCDLCAAPGGKASAILEAVGEIGFLLANEPIRSRLAPLKYNLARTGSGRYAISSLDPETLAKRLGAVFDCVVVDAPCSGQALLSRGRQNESATSIKQIEHSAARQNRILDAAIALLRHDGLLVYSTCTFAHAENEAQVNRLIQRGDAGAEDIATLEKYQTDPGCFRLWPQSHRCAGAFASAVRSKLDSGEARAKKSDQKKSRQTKADNIPPADMDRWFHQAALETMTISVDGSVAFGYAADAPSWAGRVAVAGPELAYRTGKTWKPSHEAAMRTTAAPLIELPLARASTELSLEQAQAYVNGGTVERITDRSESSAGWMVVTYGGRPLGWVKSDGRIGKNHLPTSARMTGLVRDK